MVHKQMLDLAINYTSDYWVKGKWSSEAKYQKVKEIDVSGYEVD